MRHLLLGLIMSDDSPATQYDIEQLSEEIHELREEKWTLERRLETLEANYKVLRESLFVLAKSASYNMLTKFLEENEVE